MKKLKIIYNQYILNNELIWCAAIFVLLAILYLGAVWIGEIKK